MKVYLFVVCLVVGVAHAMVFDVENYKMVQQILSDSKKLEKASPFDLIVQETVEKNPESCSCANNTCSCCLHVELKAIGLDDNICLEISFIPGDFGVSVALKVNGNVICHKEVSVKNPPPICAIPVPEKLFNLCLVLTELNYKSQHLTGCAAVEALLKGEVRENIKLGCFNFTVNQPALADGMYPLTRL